MVYGAGITGPQAVTHRARLHAAVAASVAADAAARASLVAQLEREIVCCQLLLAEIRRRERDRCPALMTT